MVPERSVAPSRGEQFLFVLENDAEGKPIAHRRSVKLGQRKTAMVEVVSGVAEGEMVVVDGSMSVQDGMSVTLHDSVKPVEQ